MRNFHLVATFKAWSYHYARLLRLASCLSITAFEHYLLFIACKAVTDAMKCCVSEGIFFLSEGSEGMEKASIIPKISRA